MSAMMMDPQLLLHWIGMRMGQRTGEGQRMSRVLTGPQLLLRPSVHGCHQPWRDLWCQSLRGQARRSLRHLRMWKRMQDQERQETSWQLLLQHNASHHMWRKQVCSDNRREGTYGQTQHTCCSPLAQAWQVCIQQGSKGKRNIRGTVCRIQDDEHNLDCVTMTVSCGLVTLTKGMHGQAPPAHDDSKREVQEMMRRIMDSSSICHTLTCTVGWGREWGWRTGGVCGALSPSCHGTHTGISHNVELHMFCYTP